MEQKRKPETGEFESEVFPWAGHLNSDERMSFCDELVKAYSEAAGTDNREGIERVIDEWKATAEALTNKRFMDEVNKQPSERSYTEVA
jgi:hypothetical protein